MLALASLSWHGVALELQSLSGRASAAPVSEHRVSPYTWQGRLPPALGHSPKDASPLSARCYTALCAIAGLALPGSRLLSGDLVGLSYSPLRNNRMAGCTLNLRLHGIQASHGCSTPLS